MNYTQQKIGQKNNLAEKFKQLDIFRIEPKFFVNDKTKFKSQFGAILSIALMGIILTACWIYGNDLYYKQNPYVSQAEEYQVKPEHFEIKKNTMNFASHHIKKSPLSRQSLYTVKMEQFLMTQTTNQNGQKQVNVTRTPLNVKICSKEDFEIDKPYFQNLPWLNKLYCMDPNQQAFIEGDYGQDIFATISIDFYPCKNTTTSQHCQPPHLIKQAIKDNYYSTYITDSLIDPKNYTSPFTNVGRNVYGIGSGETFKQVDYLYRIVEINDNSGLIFDSFTKRKGIQFTTEKENIKMTKNDDDLFLRIQIRHEKIKKTVIQRTYLNMAEVLAKVGGILKVFVSFFALISGYISQKLYRISVVNTMFSFKYKEENRKTKCYNQCTLKTPQQQQLENTPRPLHFNSILSLLTNKCQKKTTLENKSLLQHADSKIIHYLNIQKILEKMMEVDKLKLILFNQHQKQLFDYLPKPVISSDSVSKKEAFQRYREPSAILGQDLRAPNEKQKDAVYSYKKLKIKKDKNPLDEKILEILEKTNFIQENQIDLSVLHEIEGEAGGDQDMTDPNMYQSVISPTKGQLESPKKLKKLEKIILNNNKLEYQNSPSKKTKKSKFEEGQWYKNINIEFDDEEVSQDRILPISSVRFHTFQNPVLPLYEDSNSIEKSLNSSFDKTHIQAKTTKSTQKSPSNFHKTQQSDIKELDVKVKL